MEKRAIKAFRRDRPSFSSLLLRAPHARSSPLAGRLSSRSIKTPASTHAPAVQRHKSAFANTIDSIGQRACASLSPLERALATAPAIRRTSLRIVSSFTRSPEPRVALPRSMFTVEPAAAQSERLNGGARRDIAKFWIQRRTPPRSAALLISFTYTSATLRPPPRCNFAESSFETHPASHRQRLPRSRPPHVDHPTRH